MTTLNKTETTLIERLKSSEVGYTSIDAGIDQGRHGTARPKFYGQREMNALESLIKKNIVKRVPNDLGITRFTWA